MSKTLDWNAVANVNFDQNRRKATGMTTGRELFAKAHAKLQQIEDAKARRAEVEPVLKNELIKHMVNKLPITVMQPISNPTETVGGLNKSEEDDGFYHTSPSRSAEAAANVKFEETMETIPAGTTLMFKSWDKQLGQWIFKGSNGQEYAIYDKAVVMFKGGAIENPGLFGLLYNTDIIKVLEE